MLYVKIAHLSTIIILISQVDSINLNLPTADLINYPPNKMLERF